MFVSSPPPVPWHFQFVDSRVFSRSGSNFDGSISPVPAVDQDIGFPATVTTRTTTGIALSCLFTLFISMCCSIRPDMPSPHDSKFRIVLTKLNVIFWALVCPEALLLWAIRQWVEAGRIALKFQDHGWTRRHGFFLLMGGFILSKDRQPVQTLSATRLTQLLRQEAIDLPSVTVLDIQERCNFHPIIGLIAFVQILWLFFECAARLHQGLDITQLEVLTVLVVFVHGLISIFTWQKPLDTRRPILIDAKVNLEILQRRREPIHPSIKGDFDREQKVEQKTNRILQLRHEPRSRYYREPISIWRFIYRFLEFTLVWPIRCLYRDTGRMAVSHWHGLYDVPDEALKVPSFYVPETFNPRPLLFPISMLGLCASVVSCVVYALGRFPIQGAGFAWYVACTTSTSFCGLLVVGILLESFLSCPSPSITLAAVVYHLGLVPFVLSRITFFVVSVVCLAQLPQNALVIIQPWTDYIPYFS